MMSRERCDYKLQVFVTERIAKQIAAIANEAAQSESATARYLILSGLSVVGRAPQAAPPNAQAVA